LPVGVAGIFTFIVRGWELAIKNIAQPIVESPNPLGVVAVPTKALCRRRPAPAPPERWLQPESGIAN
jgi:hypothetical protein